ncbi:glycosyltransferase family 4 protein [Clostridium perfringens]|uniref:glycosyltransferase family 4 protein n=1 Tax=Clostridium perfringens TaxID=1502 RepID=UPI0022465273|nr:glycosyltransferase family 4 protein [Clostridium perfringens]MCX0356107.1 glycosyltransferase family 4 protein [Clostridium perfringens]
MKVLYISEFFFEVNGANKLSMMHWKTLKDICGEENVLTIALTGGEFINDKKYITFRSYKSRYEKMKNFMQLNNSRINNKIICEIINIIEFNNIDVVFIDNSTYGRLAKIIKKKDQSIKVISFYHDIKRNLSKQWLKKYGVKYFPDYIVTQYNEYLNSRYNDINITLNKRESDLLFKYYKKKTSLELPIYMKESNEIKNIDIKDDSFKILFVGAYYYPNVEGLRWFCKNVVPYINKKCCLYVIGKGMEVLKAELECESVKVIGEVEDISYFYNISDSVIAPIFDGAGMKVKTAEAFMFGKKFIGSSESLVGYIENVQVKLLNKSVFLANKPSEYINAIEFLYENRNDNKIDENIRQVYRDNYSDISAFNKLREIMIK